MSISRTILPLLKEYLSIFPATGILGPRQVGKTTLAKELIPATNAIYLDMENATDREKLSDPVLYLSQFADKCVILDEIQFMPSLFPALRGIIDSDRRPGRFILLGSASPDLMKSSSETLAGRIGYLELTPFLVSEVDDLQKLWIQGGFPLSYLADTERSSALWRNSLFQTYIQRNLGLMGLQTNIQVMDRFWKMLAASQGGLLNAENFARSLDISRTTINRYLYFLENAFMVRALKPWHTNINKRLVKSPKIYIRDSGILHHLMGIHSYNDLLNHPHLGNSWEGFVIEQIINHLPTEITPWFYRTHQGAECDLLLEKNGKVFAAIEIQHSKSPKTSKGFHIAMADTKAPQGYLIGNGEDTYKIGGNITITNLVTFFNLNFLK
jgi:hypothetical protein